MGRSNFIASFHALLLVTLTTSFGAGSVSADIISFELTGAGGSGLLEGNIDPPTGEVGTGDVGSTGITFNTDTNIFHVDVNWGSANGFTDLSSDVFALHWHGPTASSGDAAFGETAPLLIVLSNSASFSASATSGGVNGNFFVDSGDVQALMDGRTYINVHLSSGDGGRIRGYLRASVPEPGAGFILMFGVGVSLLTRRRD